MGAQPCSWPWAYGWVYFICVSGLASQAALGRPNSPDELEAKSNLALDKIRDRRLMPGPLWEEGNSGWGKQSRPNSPSRMKHILWESSRRSRASKWGYPSIRRLDLDLPGCRNSKESNSFSPSQSLSRSEPSLVGWESKVKPLGHGEVSRPESAALP